MVRNVTNHRCFFWKKATAETVKNKLPLLLLEKSNGRNGEELINVASPEKKQRQRLTKTIFRCLLKKKATRYRYKYELSLLRMMGQCSLTKEWDNHS